MKAIFFTLFVVSYLINGCLSEIDEAFVRTFRNYDGRTIQSLSDGKTMVTAIFNSDNVLIDCDVMKDNATVSKEFIKEVLTNSIPSGVRINSVTLDVKKLGRKCRKFSRDNLRKRGPILSKEENLSKKLFSLNTPAQGTKWCTRNTRSSHFEKLGRNFKLDYCCKIIHKSPNSIAAFSFRDGLLNFYPWNLPSCSSIAEFKRCNDDLEETERGTFSEIYLKELALPCVVIETVELCTEYDEWALKCVKYAEVSRAVLKPVE